MNIYNVFQSELDKFVQRVMPNEKISRGIINSESFAFCAIANHLNIDLVIESGICNAGSTVIWAKYFLNMEPIIAIDVDIKQEAVDRLEPHNNVIIVHGNASVEMPSLIKKMPNARIALFIDGPKNARAVQLAKRCFEFPQVQLIGVHDMCKIFYGNQVCEGRKKMDEWSTESKFYTDEPEFVSLYKTLDGEDGLESNPKYVHDGIGYGPTVGLVWKGSL